MKDLRICHVSATDPLRSATVTQGRFADARKIQLDPAMFGAIFVGTEQSRMKGMPQRHPGWLYGQ